MTNLYRSRLNYSYAVVKMQLGLASCLLRAANPENDTDETLTAWVESLGFRELSWSS